MIEIYPHLYIGNEDDYENVVKHEDGWQVVHACKEPYHRRELDYKGRGAPKEHPEYLIARRGHRLALNLVDAPDPTYIPKEIVDAALDFIHQGLLAGGRVLVHCNQGESRSPGIGLLYLTMHTDRLSTKSFTEAESIYRSIYPAYNPSTGVRGFMLLNWELYSRKK